jgi:hypothetical protein
MEQHLLSKSLILNTEINQSINQSIKMDLAFPEIGTSGRA